jgi:hypothetical protein
MSKKDQQIVDLQRKIKVQEEAIKSWIETMDTKNKIIQDLQIQLD